VALDPQLLDILACPDTHHAPLEYDESAQTLTCTECGRVFPIRDGIPVLLLDEATGGPAGGDARGAAEDKRSTGAADGAATEVTGSEP
jgi:uncharacterized protein